MDFLRGRKSETKKKSPKASTSHVQLEGSSSTAESATASSTPSTSQPTCKSSKDVPTKSGKKKFRLPFLRSKPEMTQQPPVPGTEPSTSQQMETSNEPGQTSASPTTTEIGACGGLEKSGDAPRRVSCPAPIGIVSSNAFAPTPQQRRSSVASVLDGARRQILSVGSSIKKLFPSPFKKDHLLEPEPAMDEPVQGTLKDVKEPTPRRKRDDSIHTFLSSTTESESTKATQLTDDSQKKEGSEADTSSLPLDPSSCFTSPDPKASGPKFKFN